MLGSLIMALALSGGAPAAQCGPAPVAIQVLGSGGPMHGGGRGASAYAFWRDGLPVLLFDMGGDTPTALARAGARPGAAQALLVSHMHPDHVSGLPDFLWGEIVAGRRTPLAIVGPPGGDAFLDIEMLFRRLFGPEGAFPDLHAPLFAGDFPIALTTSEGTGDIAFEGDGLRVRALRVDHGRPPALAYRIEGPGFAIVLGGDQTARDPAFAAFAADADILILHAIINRRAASDPVSRVVALPAELGQAAARANARRLVLGHLMATPGPDSAASIWSLDDLDSVLRDVRAEYAGAIAVAEDLACFTP
jgi:ribonuclease Z